MVNSRRKRRFVAAIWERLAGFSKPAPATEKGKIGMTYFRFVLHRIRDHDILIVRVVPIFGEFSKYFRPPRLPASNPVSDRTSPILSGRVGILVVGIEFADFRTRTSALTRARTWPTVGNEDAVFGPLVNKDLHVAFSRTFAQLIRAGPDLGSRYADGAAGHHVIETDQICGRRRRKKAQPLGRDVEEIDFPAHATCEWSRRGEATARSTP